MILVFLGTLDQVNIGVCEAENRYFKNFFLYFTPPGTLRFQSRLTEKFAPNEQANNISQRVLI
jgi:hypothetical protein